MMKIEFTNFECIECGEESPLAVMRVPFRCKCGFATLDKKLFKGSEYPDSLKKFYDHFNQPERLSGLESEMTMRQSEPDNERSGVIQK